MKYKNKWILNYNKGHIRFVNLDRAFYKFTSKGLDRLIIDYI